MCALYVFLFVYLIAFLKVNVHDKDVHCIIPAKIEVNVAVFGSQVWIVLLKIINLSIESTFIMHVLLSNYNLFFYY